MKMYKPINSEMQQPIWWWC